MGAKPAGCFAAAHESRSPDGSSLDNKRAGSTPGNKVAEHSATSPGWLAADDTALSFAACRRLPVARLVSTEPYAAPTGAAL